MTAHRQRRQDGRPPESFGACPMERGQTAWQPRNIQQQERKDKRREGRKGGRREGHGWPRAWGAEEGSGRSTSSREGIRERTDRQKKEIYKYLRERREKKRR